LSIYLSIVLLILVLLTGTSFADTSDDDYLKKVNFDNNSLEISTNLKKFDVVTPNTEDFMKAAENDKVRLTLLGKELELELKETNVISESAKIIKENKTGIYFVNAPYVDTYSGYVTGKDDSRVSLTVADDVLIGSIRVENKTYIIDQTNQKQAGNVIHVVYDLDDFKEREIKEYNTCGVDEKEEAVSNEIFAESLSSEGAITSSILSYTQIDILPCYDQDFEDDYANPIAEIVSMVNEVNGELANANADLNIHFFKRYGYLNVGDGSADATFDFFEDDIKPYRNMTGSDLAMLFYGKDFPGDTIGLGWSFNGDSGRAITVVQMVSAGLFSSYQATYNGRCVLITHEFGHNFGASHEEAYRWPVGHGWHYTSMWSPFAGTSFLDDYMEVEYSDLNRHGNASHNNILHVAANKEIISDFRELHSDVDTVGVYDNAGTWALWNLSSGYLDIVGYGWSGTKPVVGDWDGDDEIEVGIYDPVNYRFLLRLDSGSYQTIPLGWAGVTPVIGDWDGNGNDEPGVYDNAGTWALWNRNTNSADIVGFGWSNTKPVVGDWDNDDATEVGIYNTAGNNFLLKTGSSYQTIGLGWAGVTPVIGDWNGDGTDEPGVYNNAGTWALWNRNTNSADIVGFGWSGTTPVVGHWTGVDGKTGVGIFEATNNRFLLRVDSTLDPVFIDLGWSGVTPVIGHWNEYSTFV